MALLFALILGIGQSSQWNNWLLFTHSQSFHATDPQFHREADDIIEAAQDWGRGLRFGKVAGPEWAPLPAPRLDAAMLKRQR